MRANIKYGFSLIELSIVILVIGILVIGITKGSRIYQQAKLTSARSLTKSSPVNGTRGLNLWLDSTAEGAFDNTVSNGSAIATWYDMNSQSATKNNVTQSSNKPQYQENIVNGLPMVYFDGSDDHFNADVDIISNGAYTVIILEQRNASTAGYMIGGSHGSLGAYIGYTGSSTTCRVNHKNGGTDWQDYSVPAYTSPTPRIHSIIYNKTGTTSIVARVNGTQVLSYFVGLPGSPPAYYIGRNAAGVNYYSGHIGEIIIFRRALSTNEVSQIEQYLAAKWKVTLS